MCKDCRKAQKRKYQKQYDVDHKEEKRESDKKYRENPENKKKIAARQHDWWIENKEELSQNKKDHRKEHLEEIREKERASYQRNRDKRLEYAKDYRDNPANKERITKIKVEWAKKRRKNDPAYKMRRVISTAVNSYLRTKGLSKNGISSCEHLPYEPQQLIEHIEALFSHPDNLTPDGQIWMTWENRGAFNHKTWDPNDLFTWFWQLDHIIPHSEFNYTEPQGVEYELCWALTNLRPLSAKQNIEDGSTRVRHNRDHNLKCFI
jgi:hypothetical protein